jgi:hypothetical protein
MSSSSLSESILIIGCVLAMAGGTSAVDVIFLDSMFIPGTTVEIIVVVVVPVLSTMVVMEVCPVVVIVVTTIGISAVDGTAVGAVSIVVGVSGGMLVSSLVVRPRKSSILHKSYLVWYLSVCLTHGIGWISIVVGEGTVISVGTIGRGGVQRSIRRWASNHSW